RRPTSCGICSSTSPGATAGLSAAARALTAIGSAAAAAAAAAGAAEGPSCIAGGGGGGGGGDQQGCWLNDDSAVPDLMQALTVQGEWLGLLMTGRLSLPSVAHLDAPAPGAASAMACGAQQQHVVRGATWRIQRHKSGSDDFRTDLHFRAAATASDTTTTIPAAATSSSRAPISGRVKTRLMGCFTGRSTTNGDGGPTAPAATTTTTRGSDKASLGRQMGGAAAAASAEEPTNQADRQLQLAAAASSSSSSNKDFLEVHPPHSAPGGPPAVDPWGSWRLRHLEVLQRDVRRALAAAALGTGIGNEHTLDHTSTPARATSPDGSGGGNPLLGPTLASWLVGCLARLGPRNFRKLQTAPKHHPQQQQLAASIAVQERDCVSTSVGHMAAYGSPPGATDECCSPAPDEEGRELGNKYPGGGGGSGSGARWDQ
ncbi:hypothetical protein VaNZ11_016836, partial [Volvox africanus]